jgi:phosphoribosylglycinamide formyltransferase-1
MKKSRLAIFASGNGSNAENIMTYFKYHSSIEAVLLVCNNSNAGVLNRTTEFMISVQVFSNERLSDSDFLINLCNQYHIDFVILAGYIRMIPEGFARSFDKRIINIHPSLLPKFGGKGMYGDRVHEAVIAAGEKRSGITVHYVNAQYDKGEVIGQISCSLSNTETTESLKAKISNLEKGHFPRMIEETIWSACQQ